MIGVPLVRSLFWIVCGFYAVSTAYAGNNVYCPHTHGYIHVGMNIAEVLAECGKPTVIREGNNAVVERVPMTQFFFTNLNRGAVFQGYDAVYSMFSLPTGSVGSTVEVDVVNNKIHTMLVNNSAVNVLSVCGGPGIQVGDSIDDVLSACGRPSLTNNSYVVTPVTNDAHPQVWVYEIDSYQPTINLTFVNGLLQSIN